MTLRRLVDEARRSGASLARQREAREAAYRFMSAMAGNLPGFEEATRALFAGDAAKFASLVAAWPQAIAAYAERLAADGFASAASFSVRPSDCTSIVRCDSERNFASLAR